MARSVRFHEYGGPEVLCIEPIDPAQPGPGEVRLRILAIGLNRADALLRAGRYIEPAVFPCGIGLEAAGIVESVGPGVTGVAPGDAVNLIPPVSMVRWPACAELAVFPAALVIPQPPSLTPVAAAATWMAFLTAYGALIDVAALSAADTVVITAASSSVGLAAIQIARRIGALPVAVTRTAAKRPALLAHGAAHVIVTDEDDLAESLTALADAPGERPAASGRADAASRGIRVVLNAVAGPMVEPLTSALSAGGLLIEYGGLSSQPTPFPVGNVLGRTLTLRGFLVHEIVTDPIRLAAATAFILDGLADGSLRPVIDKIFAFDEIVAAYRYLESNDQIGKVVVTVGERPVPPPSR